MMQWAEFCELLQCLTYWYQTFCQYDLDRSGFIESQELGRVIREKFGKTKTTSRIIPDFFKSSICALLKGTSTKIHGVSLKVDKSILTLT